MVRQTAAQSATLDSRRAELKRFLNEEWEYTLRTEPELATNVGDDRYNDRSAISPTKPSQKTWSTRARR